MLGKDCWVVLRPSHTTSEEVGTHFHVLATGDVPNVSHRTMRIEPNNSRGREIRKDENLADRGSAFCGWMQCGPNAQEFPVVWNITLLRDPPPFLQSLHEHIVVRCGAHQTMTAQLSAPIRLILMTELGSLDAQGNQSFNAESKEFSVGCLLRTATCVS